MKTVGIIVILVILALACYSFADTLPDPSKVEDRETRFYLNKVKQAIGNIEITTSDPNGSRRGMFGDVVIFNDSGTYRWRVNVSTTPQGGTTWASVTS